MRVACWIRDYRRRVHVIVVAFSSVTMITRTRFNITSHVHHKTTVIVSNVGKTSVTEMCWRGVGGMGGLGIVLILP